MDPNEKLRLLTLLPISFRTVGRIYSLNNIFRSMITEVYWMNRLLSLNRPLLSINVNSARYYRFLENSFGKIKPYKGRGITLQKDYSEDSGYYGSKIDIGDDFTVALTKEGVRCRGRNYHGQCAQTLSGWANSLIQGKCKFIDVACGERHTLILNQDGFVYSFGQTMALGYTTKQVSNPIPQVIPNLPPIAQIVSGAWHSVLISRSGKVYTCGNNEYGQLGDGSVIDRILPTEIVFSRRVVQVSANERSTFFLLENGEGYISGYNLFIDGMTTEPQRVLPGRLLLHAELLDIYIKTVPFTNAPYQPWLISTTIKGDTYADGDPDHGNVYSSNRSIYDYSIDNKDILLLSYSDVHEKIDTSIQNITSRYGHSYIIS